MSNKKKDDEFYSYGRDGAQKRSYSALASQKQNFPLWRKLLRVGLIILLLALILFIGFLSKKYG